jgi:ribokinase
MRQARRAKLLVATPRAVETSQGIKIDALVGSGNDRLEQVDPDTLDVVLVVTTAGKEGGTWQAGEQRTGTFKAAELPGPLVDEYGAGDTFAGGVTYALGAGYEIDDALAFAARAGAANLTGRGPYAGQLTAEDLDT